jgi:hypothetical protein
VVDQIAVSELAEGFPKLFRNIFPIGLCDFLIFFPTDWGKVHHRRFGRHDLAEELLNSGKGTLSQKAVWNATAKDKLVNGSDL